MCEILIFTGNMEQCSANVKGNEGLQLLFPHNGSFAYWNHQSYNEFSLILSIVCIAYCVSTVSIFTSVNTVFDKTIYQKILDEEVKSDVAIRTKDSSEVKCHRSILSGRSIKHVH